MAKPPVSIQEIYRQFSSKVAVNPKKVFGLGAVACMLALTSLGLTHTITPRSLQASDHDDGDIDVRSRALSLTDLYVFREKDQNQNAREDDLIFVMNTNPRSLARQQYYFSNNARYEFRISQVKDKDAVPTGRPDTILRFTFSRPDQQNRQEIKLTTIEDGEEKLRSKTIQGRAIYTTPITAADKPIINRVKVGNSEIRIFAGLREDPFFFDVEQFFRVRAGLAKLGPSVGFRSPETALDFTKGYNVNTIVVRVPRRLLQNGSKATTFDAWLSLQIRDPRTGNYVQTEQLARPGINEALLISQKNLAAYNRLQPTRRVTPDLLEVRNEAKNTLLALGNSDARAESLLTAFLPDVMRIDTTGASGFANGFNSAGSPIRGRLLQDDVIDIALGVLSNGAVTTDNVSYAGTPGNPAQGHQPLVGSFPYLALPN